MAKLINLNVYDAKNVICVFNAKDDTKDWCYGLGNDDSAVGIMVPRLIIVGVFDDGTVKTAGVKGWDYVCSDIDDMFIFHELIHAVDLETVQAMVRWKKNYIQHEHVAKRHIAEAILRSGVEIDTEIVKYLKA